MRKQMKIAAVVSATALLAIGASFTSMAAAKTGTWTQEDGEWYCYDKNGDVYENEFCLSAGKEFYVGDDGMMVRSTWVEHDGYMYYITSEGTKLTSDWKYITPYEDDEADEEWYYFTASGKRKEGGNVVYNGAKYYFDAEGKLLTGWIDLTDVPEQADAETDVDKLVYADENGARIVNDWVYAYEPGVDVEEDDLDDYDQYWYYVKSLGAPKTGKASSINDQTYLFDAKGRMLTGWIALDGDAYTEIDEDSDELSLANYADTDVYFAAADGHVRKNKWIKEWNNKKFAAADPDVSKKWFWLQKDGTVFIPDGTDATASNAVDFVEGELDIENGTPSNATFKTINNEVYLFNENGEMMYDLVAIGTQKDVYYFGGSNDGARKIGAQSIEDDMGDAYKFYFGTEDDASEGYKKGVGVTGAKNSKLYNKGLIVTATGDYKYEVAEVGGLDYIINRSGSIQTSDKVYTDDGVELIDATEASFVKAAGVTKGSVTNYVEK